MQTARMCVRADRAPNDNDSCVLFFIYADISHTCQPSSTAVALSALGAMGLTVDKKVEQLQEQVRQLSMTAHQLQLQLESVQNLSHKHCRKCDRALNVWCCNMVVWANTHLQLCKS